MTDKTSVITSVRSNYWNKLCRYAKMTLPDSVQISTDSRGRPSPSRPFWLLSLPAELSLPQFTINHIQPGSRTGFPGFSLRVTSAATPHREESARVFEVRRKPPLIGRRKPLEQVHECSLPRKRVLLSAALLFTTLRINLIIPV